MLKPNDKILVAMSGGKDSMTLLHVLLALKKKGKKSYINFIIK
jgi:tRNA(Ile)-lysidine synthase TilS/MesJ